MIKFLKKLNTNLNLFKSLFSKLKSFFSYLKKHRLLSVSLVIFLLISGYLTFQRLRPKSPQEIYNLDTVQERSFEQTITASGLIKSETEVKLKFQTSGLLSWVGVKKGDRIKKWQAIASLDTRTLRKTLEQELIDYSKERNDFEEDRLETYDQDTIKTETIKRILQKNQWDLNRAVLDVELQDITLKYATLISPIDGILTSIDVPVSGVNITPTTAYFTVADPDNLVFEAEIDEADIGLVSASQSAQIILDAYEDEPLEVTVDSIDFNSSTDSSGSTVYIAKFKILNLDQKYRLGMNGEAIIVVAQRQNVLTVPADSLVEEEDQTIIRVVNNKEIIDQPVTIGAYNEYHVEILSGLEKDQTIIVSTKSKKKK